jgi:cytochrome b subunit of formate dehydrogenase
LFSYVFFANFQPTGQFPAIGWTPGTSPGWKIQMWAFPADFRLFNVVYHKISCLFVFLYVFIAVLGLISDLFSAAFRQLSGIYQKIEQFKKPTFLSFFNIYILVLYQCVYIFFNHFFSFFAVEVCRSNWRKNQLETKLTKNINWKPNRRKNWKPNLRSNWRKLKR